MKGIQLIHFTNTVFFVLAQRWHFPPPRILLGKPPDCVTGNGVENDARISCNGGAFNLSMGYYIPCRAHKRAREPPQWCLSIKDYNWTQYGCHCDAKIGSCIVERYQELGKNLEWSFCINNSEFYCPSSASKFRTSPKPTSTTPIPSSETTIDNLMDEFRR